MKLKNLFAVLGIGMLAIMTSCEKESGGGGGTNSPTEVVITVPTSNQIVLNGSNLVVDGTVTDANVLANVGVQIRNKTTGAVLYSSQATTAAVSFYRYTFNWTVTGITSTTVATVKVTGRDLNGGEGFREVDITLEP